MIYKLKTTTLLSKTNLNSTKTLNSNLKFIKVVATFVLLVKMRQCKKKIGFVGFTIEKNLLMNASSAQQNNNLFQILKESLIEVCCNMYL